MSTNKSKAALTKMTKEQLISEFRELQARNEDAPVLPPAAAAEASTKAKEVIAKASTLSVDTIVANGAKFGLEVQASIRSLTDQAVAKANELATLNEAANETEKRIERLYDLEVAKTSVDLLLGDYQDEVDALKEQIEDDRCSWDKEAAEHAQIVAQRNDDLKQARTREQAEYDYRTKQERQRATDEFNYRRQLAEREMADGQVKFQKAIEEAQATLAEKVKALEVEKVLVAELETNLKASADKDRAAAVNAALANQKHTFALEKKDLENQNLILANRGGDLVSQNQRLEREVAELRSQLAIARSEVVTVAEKAFAATSGQAALKAVMETNAAPANTQGKRAA